MAFLPRARFAKPMLVEALRGLRSAGVQGGKAAFTEGEDTEKTARRKERAAAKRAKRRAKTVGVKGGKGKSKRLRKLKAVATGDDSRENVDNNAVKSNGGVEERQKERRPSSDVKAGDKKKKSAKTPGKGKGKKEKKKKKKTKKKTDQKKSKSKTPDGTEKLKKKRKRPTSPVNGTVGTKTTANGSEPQKPLDGEGASKRKRQRLKKHPPQSNGADETLRHREKQTERLSFPQSYFATCGRGISPFVADELKEKFGLASEVHDGRVFFESDLYPAEFRKLRSAERVICLVIRHERFVEDPSGDLMASSSSSGDKTGLARYAAELADVCRLRGKKPWQRAYKCWKKAEKSLSKVEREEGKDSKAGKEAGYIPPSFVANAKLSGSYKIKGLDGRAVGGKVSGVLRTMLGWNPESALAQRNDGSQRIFDTFRGVEVYFHANDKEIVAGMPLYRNQGGLLNMEGRSLLYPGLRPPCAWVMGKLACVQEGHTVLDPTMGVGALLIEIAREWKNARCYIGGDCDKETLSLARANIQAAGMREKVHAKYWDVVKTGLQSVADNSVDRVVGDLPFGHRFGTAKTNATLYPEVLSESERVLVVGGLAVFLTAEIRLLKELYESRRTSAGEAVWSVLKRVSLKIGPIVCEIFVLKKCVEDSESRQLESSSRKKVEIEIQRQVQETTEAEVQQLLAQVRSCGMVPRAVRARRRAAPAAKPTKKGKMKGNSECSRHPNGEGKTGSPKKGQRSDCRTNTKGSGGRKSGKKAKKKKKSEKLSKKKKGKKSRKSGGHVERD